MDRRQISRRAQNNPNNSINSTNYTFPLPDNQESYSNLQYPFAYNTNLYNNNFHSNYQNAHSHNITNSSTQNYFNNYSNQMFFMNQINNMNNALNNMNNIISNMKSEHKQDKQKMGIKIGKLEKESKEQKIKIENLEIKNGKLEKETREQKIKIVNLEIKNGKLEKEIIILKKNEKEKNNEIFERMNKIELDIKDLNGKINNLNEKREDKLLEKINKILNGINEEIKSIKEYINKKTKENKEENEKMKKTIEKLKEIIKELQDIIIRRKMLKIILKKIILNCFESFSIETNNKKYYIENVILKDKKYSSMINISNNILDAIFQSNRIIHIDGAIHRLIDLINNETTYGDLLDICEKSIKKNDLQLIKKLFDENLLSLKVCYPEIIDEDESLFKILSELSINNMQ